MMPANSGSDPPAPPEYTQEQVNGMSDEEIRAYFAANPDMDIKSYESISSRNQKKRTLKPKRVRQAVFAHNKDAVLSFKRAKHGLPPAPVAVLKRCKAELVPIACEL